MNKKKILGMAICLALLTGCSKGGESSSSQSSSGSTSGGGDIGKLELKETMDKVTITNADVSIVFDKINGSVLSFINLNSGNDYVKDTVGGNWALLYTAKTDDVFEAKPTDSSTKLITSRNQEAIYSGSKSMDSIELTFTYSVPVGSSSTSNLINITNTIKMEIDNPNISIKYDVENKLDKGVIISFTGAQLTGLKSNEKEWNLYWPTYEGKIYSNAIEKSKNETLDKLSLVYPVPASVQLMQLYQGNDSLYYFIKDNTREYKTLNFGPFIGSKEYDNGAVETVDKVSMSITQYPYIKKDNRVSLFETIIGVSKKGDYYSGTNEYSKFLIESGMTKTKSDFAKEFNGYTPLIMDREDAKDFATYVTPTGSPAQTTIENYIDKYQGQGINVINLLGWHKGGFDHMYPDYEFKTGNGYGEDNFEIAMNNLNSDGKYAVAYINAHIADVESNWSKTVYDSTTGRTNIERAAIKNKRYSYETTETQSHEQYVNTMILENYGTTTYYYAMCPSSKLFQDAICDACKRLREKGVVGIWFDQLMQMPANLCFDPTHGHKTPATAYGEGYSEMLTRVNEIMETFGDGPYFHSAEGICDAYVQWVDACGYLWSRPFGAVDLSDGTNYAPEITRAAIPAVFLGQDGAGAYPKDEDEYAQAFIMFDPFLVSTEDDKVTKFTNLYVNDSTYLNGNYIGSKGISSSNEDFMIGGMLSKDNKKLIINIYNFSNASASSDISIDLSRLGLSKISSMTVALGDRSKFSLSNNVIKVNNLSEREVCSIKLIVE